MDKTNLARVFGPTIVGHGMAEPPPRTILRDTTVQPKVGSSHWAVDDPATRPPRLLRASC